MFSSFTGRRLGFFAVLAGFTLMPDTAPGQFISDINSLSPQEYRLICCPGSTLTINTDDYPMSASIDDQYNSTSGGIHHANRHDLRFAVDEVPRIINGTDSFDISFDVTLNDGLSTPRKEAGFLIEQPGIGASQFIVNTDPDPTNGHEIVVFGGFQPFYKFNLPPDGPGPNYGHNISYIEGETINMRMIYHGRSGVCTPTDNENCNRGNFQYLVTKDGVTYSSPVIDSPASGNNEFGIKDGSTLRLYLQGKGANVSDFATATFENIVFGTGIPAGPDGDFNDDGVVDAADYVVWRHAGAADELPNDPTPGVVDESDYGVWAMHFGEEEPEGMGAGTVAIPEPATAALGVIGMLGILGLIRRR